MSVSNITLVHPEYDRSALRPRILHLGFGAFARAHPLFYTDLALESCGGDWGVAVARLNSGVEQLSELDQAGGIYTVAAIDDNGVSARRVGCVIQSLHPARDGADAIPDLIASPALAIITLSITEKGYCLAGNQLDMDLPEIRQDLANPDKPRTAIGAIVEGLQRRRATGLGAVTVLSCDNLPANGDLCRQAVLSMATARDPSLAQWIGENCTFPCSMVDRIVPALNEDGQRILTDLLGHADPNGIVCEPFRQWVIEHDFAADRPDWQNAGAEFVQDVAPYEEMKLRMLNGAHSFLAYLGALAGHKTVADCMQDELFRNGAHRLMLLEQAPTLRVPEDVDLRSYADRLIDRFGNSRLHHRTIQIAMDGSQKLPQRLLAPVKSHLQDGRAWPLSAMAIAGWMRFVRGQAEDGTPLSVQDPLAETLAQCSVGKDGDAYVDALLEIDRIFDAELAGHPAFRSCIHDAYRQISQKGTRLALAEAAKQNEAQS